MVAAPHEPRHHLPAPRTALIGRAREIAEVCRLLRRPEARLLVLTGAGGAGKTRLAIAVAEHLRADFDDAITFVSLAPISDPALVASAIAQAIGIRESAERSLRDGLVAVLVSRRLLLILDNFEHVLPAARLIDDLLTACPRLTILVTSRAVLRLSGERNYLVPPLSLPDPQQLPPLEQLGAVEAIQLFVERAQAAQADFTLTPDRAVAVAAICRRLDGLPLAIELAAARISLLSTQALLARLAHRLQVLTGGPRDAPARQQPLRATLAWSYDLLPPATQWLFRQLAVFAGGWTLGAAEAVCVSGDDIFDGLAALVDYSLVW